VRRRREALRITLLELGERSDLTASYIGGIELGNRDPSLTTIYALAKGLGISASEFFSSVADLTPASEEVGRLFDQAEPEIQKVILAMLRSMLKLRRK
jgi:transcriptional regulator with XRE-family HTH domain